MDSFCTSAGLAAFTSAYRLAPALKSAESPKLTRRIMRSSDSLAYDAGCEPHAGVPIAVAWRD
jgi:hypothetical protein